MDVLQLLEQKISSLVDRVKKLQEESKRLHGDVVSLTKERENLAKEREKLKTENGKLAEENMRLFQKVTDLEKKALTGKDQIDELNQERALTKLAVDDLLEQLQSIDSLIEKQ